MDVTLLLTAAALGLGGSWHCALMCGPLCAAQPGVGWLIGRTLGYSVAGAALGGMASWGAQFVIRGGAGAWSPWLTLWAMAHAAALSLGLFMLWRGEQPQWLTTLGRRPSASRVLPVQWRPGRPSAHAAQTLAGNGMAMGTGMAWVFLPCGLLQSAFVVSALAPSALTGGMTMAVFSLASAPGLVAAPALLRSAVHTRRASGASAISPISTAWRPRLIRLSGLFICGASAWALGHGLWIHVRDVC